MWANPFAWSLLASARSPLSAAASFRRPTPILAALGVAALDPIIAESAGLIEHRAHAS